MLLAWMSTLRALGMDHLHMYRPARCSQHWLLTAVHRVFNWVLARATAWIQQWRQPAAHGKARQGATQCTLLQCQRSPSSHLQTSPRRERSRSSMRASQCSTRTKRRGSPSPQLWRHGIAPQSQLSWQRIALQLSAWGHWVRRPNRHRQRAPLAGALPSPSTRRRPLAQWQRRPLSPLPSRFCVDTIHAVTPV